MDDVQSAKQIQQMVNFILNEAKDKAEEIDAKTLEEFNIERLKYAQEQKDIIRKEFGAKKKKLETAHAIARSTAINKARMEKVEARQQFLQTLKKQCEAELKALTSDKTKYANLIADLIVQGCLKLCEDFVTIKCKKDDESIVKSALDAAARKYADVIKRETRATKSLSLSISPSYLPPQCGGGVVLTCAGNSISVDNTLNTRLNLVMDNDLPSLRKILYRG